MHQDHSDCNKDFIRNHIGIPIRKFFSFNQPTLMRLVSCFCLGALGISASDKLWGDFQTSPAKPMINVSHSNSGNETHPESYESYQLRILRNQNHLQAEKIKALRDEMHEVTQKLHELKPHLFKQGDPADQAKIAQLIVLLGEKEEALNELTAIKEKLDKDLGTAKKKLIEMEIVKEALASMVDSHRDAKERNSADFKKQLAEIHLATEQEKSDLLRKIQQHEAIQDKLNQQLAAKGHTINRLDDLTSKMNSSLAAKNDDLLQLEGHILSLYDIILQTSEHHVRSHQIHENQIQDLVTALDWERTNSYQLGSFQEESQWLSDIFIGTKETLIKELEQLQQALLAEQAKNDTLINLHNQLKANLKQKSDDIQKLVLLIEVEQTKSQNLENELLTLLNQQEADNQRLNIAEAQLYEVDSRLASKNDELENVTAEFTSNFATLLSHLDSAESSAERTKSEWEVLNSKYNDNFGTLLSHLDQHDAELKDTQDKHLHGLGTLFSHLDHSEQASHKFLKDYFDTKESLESSLAKQKLREEALQKSLDETYEAYKQENHRMAELEKLVEESNQHSKLAAMELLSANVVIASLEKNLTEHHGIKDDLSKKLSDETIHAINLELLLHENLAQTEQLSRQLSEHKEFLQIKEKEYETLEQTHTLTKESFNSHLEDAFLGIKEEEQANIVLKDALDQMITQENSQWLKIEELEFQKERLSEELNDKIQRLSLLENKLVTVEYDNKELAQENHLLQGEINTHHLAENDHKEEVNQLNSLIEKMRNDIEQAEQKLLSLADAQALLQHQAEKLAENEDVIVSITQNHDVDRKGFETIRTQWQEQLEEITSKLVAEEERNKLLEDDLSFTRSNYTRERSNLLNLEKIHQESHEKISQLQKQHEQYETELHNASMQAQNLMQSRNQIENTLSSQYQKQISELQAALETKPVLEEELKTTVLSYQIAQNKIQELEAQLAAQKTQISQQVDETLSYLETLDENHKLRQENEQLERLLSNQTQKIAEWER